MWRWPANFLRGVLLFLFVLAVALAYGLARLGLWLIVRDRARRASRVRRLQGKTLRRSMTILGATFIKMGQVMSSRPDLFGPEIIDELRHLQDRLPPFSYRRARRVIEAELGKPIGELFRDFDQQPVAAASVAQVHRAHLPDGSEVAVKVLRPSIRRRVERDAGILLFGARLVALSPKLRLSDPVGHLKEFVGGIVDQTDLTLEADNYERFLANFADTADVRFPRIHRSHSARRVLTMEFMHGDKLERVADGKNTALAITVRGMMMKMCFADGFVHADLHPGNILVHERTQLVVFDAGMAKLLGPDVLEQFVDFTRCVTMGTADDFITHCKRFHSYMEGTDWVAFRVDIEGLMVRFRGQDVRQLEYSKFFNDIFALARTHRVRPIPEMMLIMVALVTAEGIGKRLDPDVNIFDEVARYLVPLLMAKPEPRSQRAT